MNYLENVYYIKTLGVGLSKDQNIVINWLLFVFFCVLISTLL